MRIIGRGAIAPVLLVATLAAGACASSRPDVFDQSSAEAERALITAENQNFLDATVYAVWEVGARDRLGTVTGLTSQTFELDVKGSELRVQVDFVAGGNFTSDRILVGPGDHVQVTIPPS